MKAQKVNIIIEKSPGGKYMAFMEEPFGGFGLAGHGGSAEEAINDLNVSRDEMKELLRGTGYDFPQLKFNYLYDIRSFLNHIPCLSISRVAELAGIAPSMMNAYAKGSTKAGQPHYEKINNAVKEIINGLA